MDSQIEKLIERIIYLPKEYENVNKSTISIVQESGYFELYNKINEEQIAAMLQNHPQTIENWLQWSEDKRSGGWYFTKGGENEYGVGYYPDYNFDFMDFSDKFKACAAYIIREIEMIRLYQTKS